MKGTIHPQWFPEAQVTCACGNMFTVGSTKPEIHIEICSRCHPFYTGEQRFATAVGKVERFQERIKKAKVMAPVLAAKKAKKIHAPIEDKGPKSLKEMLLGLQ